MSSTSTQFKGGDVRPDGFIFKSYRMMNGVKYEDWRSKDSYERYRFATACCNARRRAKQANVPFDITTDYIQDLFPDDYRCPITGVEMLWGKDNYGNSPSLDRILPELGYVRGNVVWISNRINQIKSDASIELLSRIVDYYKTLNK